MTQPAPARRRGRPTKGGLNTVTTEQAELIVASAIGGLNFLATRFAGPGAAMNDLERDDIAAPMGRLLQRLPAAQAAAVAAAMDPITVGIILTSWGARVYDLRRSGGGGGGGGGGHETVPPYRPPSNGRVADPDPEPGLNGVAPVPAAIQQAIDAAQNRW